MTYIFLHDPLLYLFLPLTLLYPFQHGFFMDFFAIAFNTCQQVFKYKSLLVDGRKEIPESQGWIE